jgi:hypothetical protein
MLDMWLLKFMTRGWSFETISGNRFLLVPKTDFRDRSLAFSLTPSVFCPLIQDGEKRLLAFTKRGTAIHSVSCPILPLSSLLYIYVYL